MGSHITIEQRIRELERGPTGPSVGAFFDLDGTLVAGYTVVHVFRELWNRGVVSRAELAGLARPLLDRKNGAVPLVEEGAALLAGKVESDLNALAHTIFARRIAKTMRWPMRDLVRAHQRLGHTVALATSATQFQAEPVASDLGIADVLCSRLTAVDGVLTGEIKEGVLWGPNKARAVRQFAQARGINLEGSYGYGNGNEDERFLETVGHPTPVTPSKGLAGAARRKGWPVMMVKNPKGTTPLSAARTITALLGLNAGLVASIGAGVVSGHRREVINKMTPHVAKMTLTLAGVNVDVKGLHNMVRPAVFTFNHQSNVDPVVVGMLVKRDFTAVGKQETRSDPRAYLASQVMDVTLIDRSNPEAARASVAALAEKIQKGTSVIIAPEGTRMPTPTLGRFKKGAFFLAMAARVPIVPIVLRNSGELMPRGASVIHAGTIDVRILEPIPTVDWTAEDMDAQVELVRERYREALES